MKLFSLRFLSSSHPNRPLYLSEYHSHSTRLASESIMSSANSSLVTKKHILLTAAPTWSHFRSVCFIAATFAAERPITVTLLVPYYQKTFQQAQQEVDRCLADVKSPPGVVRIIAFGEHSSDLLSGIRPNIPAFEEFWRRTLHSSAITCSATGKEYPGVAKPSFVFVDPFQYDIMVHIRSIHSPAPIPVFAWVTGFTGMIISWLFPKKYGGLADFILPEYTQEEIAKGRYLPTTGEVRHVRGTPDMYDWETYPQDIGNLPFPSMQDGIPFFLHTATKMIQEADGLATASTVGYDGEQLLSVVDEWVNENGRTSFHLGPVLPLKPGTSEFSQAQLDAEIAAAPPGIGDRVINFLDEALKSNGEHSVIYICFGTNFWPTNPDHLWTLLEIISDRGIPFILSHASPVAQVPDHIKEKYSNSPNGLLVSWAPQQTILGHKSIGWFVTHGGAGGTMDALTQGVPMIGWPFSADQPNNIAHLVHTLDVAFEFIEVRTGKFGLKPIYLTGKTPKGTLDAFREEVKSILDELSFEAGRRKRANAQKQQKILAQAWAPGGATYASFQRLVQKFDL